MEESLTAQHIHTSRLPETASCSNATTWGAVDLSKGPKVRGSATPRPAPLARARADRRAERSLRSASAGSGCARSSAGRAGHAGLARAPALCACSPGARCIAPPEPAP